MPTNKITDTTELLSDKDYEAINEIKKITHTIFYYIDKDLLLERIRNIVDESQIVNFRNERSKKFIDKNRPVLYLVVDKDLLIKNNQLPKFNTEDQEASFYSNIAFTEVLSKINAFINDCAHNNSDIQEFLNGRSLFKDLEKDGVLAKSSLFSSIFGIRIDRTNKNNVTVEMMI
jgi:hypothetical protein